MQVTDASFEKKFQEAPLLKKYTEFAKVGNGSVSFWPNMVCTNNPLMSQCVNGMIWMDHSYTRGKQPYIIYHARLGLPRPEIASRGIFIDINCAGYRSVLSLPIKLYSFSPVLFVNLVTRFCMSFSILTTVLGWRDTCGMSQINRFSCLPYEAAKNIPLTCWLTFHWASLILQFFHLAKCNNHIWRGKKITKSGRGSSYHMTTLHWCLNDVWFGRT